MTNTHEIEPSTKTKEQPPADVTTPEDPQNGSQGQDPNKGLTEARDRYRSERDAAREDLAAASTRIERMLRAEVERLAADALSHPADLFSLSGNGVADYLTEAGDVDADKVAADVAAVLAERPGLRKGSPLVDPTRGTGGRQAPPKAEPSWGSVFKS